MNESNFAFLAEHVDEYTVSELRTGIRTTGTSHTCILCGATFEVGRIYAQDSPAQDSPTDLTDASLAAKLHVASERGGTVEPLLALPRAVTGLSETQTALLEAMNAGLDDKAIARTLGGKAESTIRNHRFQMRRRRTEAMIFLALIDQILEREETAKSFVHYPSRIAASDERVITTIDEATRILERYTDSEPAFVVKKFPRKAKERLVILKRITDEFEPDRRYSEREVNAILEAIFSDYVTIRRYLIDYRFLDRKPGGLDYRVNR